MSGESRCIFDFTMNAPLNFKKPLEQLISFVLWAIISNFHATLKILRFENGV